MVFSPITKRAKRAFGTGRDNQIVNGPPIKDIAGHFLADGINILDLDLGTLIINENMEYLYSGTNKFLKTRRGSTLQKDIVMRVLGGSQYSDTTSQSFVWINEDGVLQYLDGTNVIVDIQAGLDISKEYESFMYGHPITPFLYFSSEEEGLLKVSSAFVYSSVLSTGIISMAYSNISRRLLIALDGHKIAYSNQQPVTAIDTSNLETFDLTPGGDWIFVSPDEGVGIKKIVDNGSMTFFFKDVGIWVLTNAEEDPLNWDVPKCNADQGTLSPKTVVFGRYGQAEGFLYLAADKTLRFFNASVQRNAGAKPTLIGGDSRIISNPFQKILNDIPSDHLDKCNAVYFDRLYILNIVSINGIDIDTTLIIDTGKLIPAKNNTEIPQPLWFTALNLNLTHYLIQKKIALYGYNKDGYIAKLFVSDTYHDETPARISTYSDDIMIDAAGDVTLIEGDAVLKQVAIQWKAYFGWYKFADTKLKLYDAYVGMKVEGYWPVNFDVNSFEMGAAIPSYSDGNTVELKPYNVSGSYYDYAYFDVSYFSGGDGSLSQSSGQKGEGHYFLFGIHNSNIHEPVSFYGIEPRFKAIKKIPMGKRN